MQAYLCSNKWSMNPKKLAEYTQTTLISANAKKYLKHVVDGEMPCALKKYMEVELFP